MELRKHNDDLNDQITILEEDLYASKQLQIKLLDQLKASQNKLIETSDMLDES